MSETQEVPTISNGLNEDERGMLERILGILEKDVQVLESPFILTQGMEGFRGDFAGGAPHPRNHLRPGDTGFNPNFYSSNPRDERHNTPHLEEAYFLRLSYEQLDVLLRAGARPLEAEQREGGLVPKLENGTRCYAGKSELENRGYRPAWRDYLEKRIILDARSGNVPIGFNASTREEMERELTPQEKALSEEEQAKLNLKNGRYNPGTITTSLFSAEFSYSIKTDRETGAAIITKGRYTPPKGG